MMSVTRIVRRNLVRAGEAHHFVKGKEWRLVTMTVGGRRVRRLRKVKQRGWMDFRARDSFGHLLGHCSKVMAERRAHADSR